MATTPIWPRRRVLGALGALAVPALLGGCASGPQMRSTTLKFLIDADASINPNEDGQPSPVVVRIYELKSSGAFLQAQFFDLFDQDTQKLGQELLNRREFDLKPGDRQEFDRQAPADALFIGVIAGFRQINQARWRDVTAIEPEQGTNIVIRLTAQSVTIETGSIRRFGLF